MKKVTINKDGHYEFDETPAVIQPFSMHLEKLRDELAEEYFADTGPGYLGQGIWDMAFDKGAEEMAKMLAFKDAQIEGLVEALEQIMKTPPYTNTEIAMQNCAFKALENFSEWRIEEK